ncbi:hypothetical protein RND71_015151 [Anisodus tanguticus]|uniref:Uncharacterized protein n=1 Tax=Anisodus tanguticus TaxID=243964 RepID=A0AAE1VKI8_9SOLA|nr:hypothetical protein RND71_015151 [Anisodus tanguticus]
MGRKIPLGEVHPNHPLIYFLFLTASIVSIIGIVSSLCGLLERIKGSPAGDSKENAAVVSTSQNEPENAKISDANNEESSDKRSEENILQPPLPPPPAMRAVASHNLRTNSMAPTRVSRSNSSIKSIQRKLSTSMSMKVTAFSGALTQRREKINSKLKHEDSIWKKQIILGEKCKVPNHDEDDDTVIYDENGNKISPYYPKQLNVLSMSRQSSEIDANAIPK